MRLRLTFTEPFTWTAEAYVSKETLKGFKTLDEVAEYIVDMYLYYKWEKVFDKMADALEMPIEKREDAKIRYRLKMAEYVKKWLVEAVMARRS